MKILIASPYLPWPLLGGGLAAQFSTLQCLAEDHQFSFVCPVYSEAEVVHARELAVQLPRVKVNAVFCGPPPPVPSSMPWLVKALRPVVRAGRRCFQPSQAPAPSPGSGAELSYPFSPLPKPFLEALSLELAAGTDLFQAEFAEMMPLGTFVTARLPKLFVHHQIHFIYARRFIEAHGMREYWNYLATWMKDQEFAYLRHFDAVITFSEVDQLALAKYPHLPPAFSSPFPVPADVGLAQNIPSGFDGRFLFVGSDGLDANRDALDWLASEVWPVIAARLPEARLMVIGQWSEAVQARFASPAFTFTGFVQNLPAVIRGGIMLVPVRIGSGIRTKILVALAQGVPVVTTPIGVEGLLAHDGAECLVRVDGRAFASAAIGLAQQPELWHRLATAGLQVIGRHYTPEAVRRRRNEIYGRVVEMHRMESAQLQLD
jgi:glycosyltransferase involved in cell wall biosynthesis